MTHDTVAAQKHHIDTLGVEALKEAAQRFADSSVRVSWTIEIEPDPWGNPYVLEVYGNEMTVRSLGPNGKKDAEDDIDVCLEEEED